MPYKDKDRVRQYQRKWVRQRRQGSTDSLRQGSTVNVIPDSEGELIVDYVDPIAFKFGEVLEYLPHWFVEEFLVRA